MVPDFWNKLNEREKRNTENYLGGINDKYVSSLLSAYTSHVRELTEALSKE